MRPQLVLAGKRCPEEVVQQAERIITAWLGPWRRLPPDTHRDAVHLIAERLTEGVVPVLSHGLRSRLKRSAIRQKPVLRK